MGEIIFEDKRRNLVIQRDNKYTSSFLTLLERTIWGSGGLKYTLNGISDILDSIKNPHFFSLSEDNKLLAVITMMEKTTRIAGSDYPAFYSYAFSVDAQERGKGYGTLLADQALKYGLNKIGEKGIDYCFIEADNIRSLKTMQKVGRKSLGQYHSLIISRLFPKDNDYIEKLAYSQRDQIVELLYKTYENHSLVDFDQGVKAEDYYILRKGNDVIAGLQCARKHLIIEQMSGPGGLFLTKILPKIPILNKLLPNRNYRFLIFGNIYLKEGFEQEVFKLMEALLARNELNFGMIYMDKRSPVYQKLKSVGKFGVFNSLVDVPVHVMACLKGFKEDEMAEFAKHPIFISMMAPV